MTMTLQPTRRADCALVAILAGWFALLALISRAHADAPKLDVPYVPTPMPVVERMLELGQVREGHYVIDLGSGDGRIPITAARRYGARGFGVDIDPRRISEAIESANREGVSNRVKFDRRNLFDVDFSQADVLTMYLLPTVNMQLKPRILNDMKPGARVVSHAFDLGRWTPDAEATVDGKRIYSWIVPAKVAGRWQVRQGDQTFVVNLNQEFQKIVGEVQVDGRSRPISAAELTGDRITLTFAAEDGIARTLRGRVMGDRIVPDEQSASAPTGTGTRTSSGTPWEAARLGT